MKEPALAASSNLAERRADEEFAKAEELMARIAAAQASELPALLEEIAKHTDTSVSTLLAKSALWQR